MFQLVSFRYIFQPKIYSTGREGQSWMPCMQQEQKEEEEEEEKEKTVKEEESYTDHDSVLPSLPTHETWTPGTSSNAPSHALA